MTPRPKEGGAFLRFAYDKNVISLDEIQKRVQTHLKNHAERPWFNPIKRIDAWVVKGRPWIEDLHRFPSNKLRIEFEGPDLTQETLYSVPFVLSGVDLHRCFANLVEFEILFQHHQVPKNSPVTQQ